MVEPDNPNNARQVPQDSETHVQLVKAGSFSYRYAYARSADTRAAGDLGQDFLAFQQQDSTFIFVLCDGVSQSFFGEVAARILGEGLLGWLSNAVSPGLDNPLIADSLTERLEKLTVRGREEVEAHPLPENIPAMLREVLEQKRGQGSESMFICGRLDLPTHELPKGRAVLAWMGDSRLRIWGPAGERTSELGDALHLEQRWSTHKGIIGPHPNLVVTPRYHAGQYILKRVLAYSDGLATLDDLYDPVSNFGLQDMISQAGETATSDDISLIELWLGPLPAEVKAEPLPAPGGLVVTPLQVQGVSSALRASWRPVPGAERYEVEVRGEERRLWSLETPEWTSPPLPPGNYVLNVRALSASGPGVWSVAFQVEIQGVAKTASGNVLQTEFAPVAAHPRRAGSGASTSTAPGVEADKVLDRPPEVQAGEHSRFATGQSYNMSAGETEPERSYDAYIGEPGEMPTVPRTLKSARRDVVMLVAGAILLLVLVVAGGTTFLFLRGRAEATATAAITATAQVLAAYESDAAEARSTELAQSTSIAHMDATGTAVALVVVQSTTATWAREEANATSTAAALASRETQAAQVEPTSGGEQPSIETTGTPDQTAGTGTADGAGATGTAIAIGQATASPTTRAVTSPITATISASSPVNLRDMPGLNSSIIASYADGTEVMVLGKDSSGEWLRVRAEKGLEGWMTLQFLDVHGDLNTVPIVGPDATAAAPTHSPTVASTSTATGTATGVTKP